MARRLNQATLPERKAMIRSLRAAGLTFRQVAARTGVSLTTAYHHAKGIAMVLPSASRWHQARNPPPPPPPPLAAVHRYLIRQ